MLCSAHSTAAGKKASELIDVPTDNVVEPAAPG